MACNIKFAPEPSDEYPCHAGIHTAARVGHRQQGHRCPERLERGHERTASVIAMLVEDIDQLGRKVERITAPSPYSKRRIGYIIDED
jgi:hypothetical protein